MSLIDYYDRQIPAYYPTMYQDGFSPEQIMFARHRDMMDEYEERNSIPTFHLVSHIEVKR